MAGHDLEVAFVQGKHAHILAETFDTPDMTITPETLVFILGSLVFHGRLDEADILFTSHAEQLTPPVTAESRFYLALGFSRRWHFSEARRYLWANVQVCRRGTPKQRFFMYQGLSFYHFMRCRYQRSLDYASKAYKEALRANYFYGRALATDLQGHAQLAVGEVFQGIQSLERAHAYFEQLGNDGHAKAIARSLVSGKARHSINLDENFAALQQLVREDQNEENHYSLAGSYLNICRLYCLTGQVTQAEQQLNQVAALIQQSSHERYAVLLNFRRAYCAYLRGHYQKALTHLQSVPAQAIHADDLRTRMQILGLEEAIGKAAGKPGNAERHRELNRLTIKSGYHIGRRILARRRQEQRLAPWGRDPLGDLLDDLHDPGLGLEDKVELIKKSGYWSFLYPLVPVDRSRPAIVMNLLPGLIVVMNHGDIRTHTANPGSQLIKILQLLAQRRQTKQELIEKLWGYEYSPLRHDSLIYGLLSRVRSLLGDGQEWVSADEEGYHLHADVQVYFHQPVNDSPRLEEAAEPQPRAPAEPYPASGPSPDTAQLINQRQFKILRYVEQHEFINLKSCQELLADVSKVTLSRDLSFLVDQKLLVRTGKGRNTAYMRAPKESRAHL